MRATSGGGTHRPTAKCPHQKQNKSVTGVGPWSASWHLHFKNTSPFDFIIKYFLTSQHFLGVCMLRFVSDSL